MVTLTRSLLITTAVLLPAAGLSVAGTAMGAARTADTTVRACQAKKTGVVRVLTGKKAKCRKGERRISWNTTGPAGPAGPTGPAPAWAGTPFMPVLLNIPDRALGTTGGQWVNVGSASFTPNAAFRYRAQAWFSVSGIIACPGGSLTNMRTMTRASRVAFNGVAVPDGLDANGDFPQSGTLPDLTDFYLPYSGPQTVSLLVRVDDSVMGNSPPPPCTMPMGDAQVQVIGYPVG